MAELICRLLRDGSLEGEHSPALTIKDSLESHTGADVFNYFLFSLVDNIITGKSQARGLILVTFTQSPSSYFSLLKRRGLDASALDNFLQILDCYSDPLGWKEKILQSGGPDKTTSKESDYICRDVKDINKLLSWILEDEKGFAGECKARFAVAIDSVSSMLRYVSMQMVASFISKIRSQAQVSCMFWLLHADLHEPRSTAVIEYISSIVASLEPMAQPIEGKKGPESLFWLGRNLQKGRFHVRIKRRNGRVKIINEEFHMEQAGISFAAPSTESMIAGQTRLPKLQFNLQLSEKERDDRARVVLPFEHQGSGEHINIYDGRRSLGVNLVETSNMDFDALSIEMEGQGEQIKGEIHYIRDSDDEQPDSDEDPDDDLDI